MIECSLKGGVNMPLTEKAIKALSVIYVSLILDGRRTIDEVPPVFRKQVMSDLGIEEPKTEQPQA